MTDRAPAVRPAANRLPRTVVIIGLVSLFNDFASEMVTPLIPLLLATVLGAGPMALGFIEGLADTTTNLLKLWAGRRSDMTQHRRKPFVLFGYTLSNLVRPLIGFSGSWLMVLGIRVTDRIGKGLRSAPRDAMLADVIPEGMAARAYGLTRALDHAEDRRRERSYRPTTAGDLRFTQAPPVLNLLGFDHAEPDDEESV